MTVAALSKRRIDSDNNGDLDGGKIGGSNQGGKIGKKNNREKLGKSKSSSKSSKNKKNTHVWQHSGEPLQNKSDQIYWSI